VLVSGGLEAGLGVATGAGGGQAVEGASFAGRGRSDGLEFLHDRLDRAVRLGDVGDEAAYGPDDGRGLGGKCRTSLRPRPREL